MKISVIMPVYNCEKYLKKSIESVINQTFNDFELILIDDGSSDNSGIICDDYGKKDKRIRVFHTNSYGPSYARNLGLDKAEGEYVTYVDSDDYLEKNAFKIMIRNIKEDTEILFYPNYNDIYEDGKYSFFKNNSIGRININSNEEFRDKYTFLMKNFYVNQVWNKLYKKSFINKYKPVSPVNIKKSEDILFNLQLYIHLEKAIIIEIPLYHYVNHKSFSICSTFKLDSYKYIKEVYIRNLRCLRLWNPKAVNTVRNFLIKDLNINFNSLYNKETSLSYEEKKKYVLNIVNDEIVKECIKNTKVIGYRNKITSLLIKLKFTSGILLLSKITRKIKKTS